MALQRMSFGQRKTKRTSRRIVGRTAKLESAAAAAATTIILPPDLVDGAILLGFESLNDGLSLLALHQREFIACAAEKTTRGSWLCCSN